MRQSLAKVYQLQACESRRTGRKKWLCYDIFTMVRSFVRASVAAFTLVALRALPAFAQAPTPTKGGHPWHWWMAVGALAIGGFTLLAAVAGFLVQAPGFRKVQHKQGQPR